MRRRNRRLFCRLHARLNANGRFDGRRQGQGYFKVFWGWGYSKASKYATSKYADLADTWIPAEFLLILTKFSRYRTELE